MTPPISFPPIQAVDITRSLLAARDSLKLISNDEGFRQYLSNAISRGPLSDLDRRERDGRSHFKILYIRGNGFDAPLGTFLVLSIPHEAIGMPGFERELKLHVRETGVPDGFQKTYASKNDEFRAKLELCSDPSFLASLIVAIFGRP